MGKNAVDDFGGEQSSDRLRKARSGDSRSSRSSLHDWKAGEGGMSELRKILGKREEAGKRALVQYESVARNTFSIRRSTVLVR